MASQPTPGGSGQPPATPPELHRLASSRRIVLMPVVAAAAFLTLFVLNWVENKRAEGLLAQIAASDVPAFELTTNLTRSLDLYQRALQDAVAASDTQHVSVADAIEKEMLAQIESASVSGALDRRTAEEVDRGLGSYCALARSTSLAMIERKGGTDLTPALERMTAGYNHLRGRLDALAAQRKAKVHAALADTRASQRTYGRIFGVVILACLTILAALSIVIGRAEARAADALRESEERFRQLNEELEGRVHARTAQLEASNRELEAFSYSVSHDLRAPLRAIDGFSQKVFRAHGDRLDDEGRRLLGVIRESAQQMAQLIDDLLLHSRVSRHKLRRSRIDMEHLVAQIWNELIAQDPEPPAELALSRIPEAFGDPALLRQVFTNLLSNALKFSSKRERRLVAVGSADQAGETVYFVRDNGAGFDMAYSGKLFGVFQRLHRQTDFAGTGVGLAIVRRIVERHGGRVWAEGRDDGGATFFFTLAPKTTDEPGA